MLKMCCPFFGADFSAAHFLQLRQWCSAIAHKASADLHPSSPVLAADAASAATAGGTVAPSLLHITQMMPLPLVSEAEVTFPAAALWGSAATFHGMAPELTDY